MNEAQIKTVQLQQANYVHLSSVSNALKKKRKQSPMTLKKFMPSLKEMVSIARPCAKLSACVKKKTMSAKKRKPWLSSIKTHLA